MSIWVPYPVDQLHLPADVLARADIRAVDLTAPFGVVPEAPEGIDRVTFFVVPYGFDFAVFDLLGQMTALEVVQVQFAGVESVRGRVPASVTLCNGGGIHDDSTSELALTLTLASLRGIPGYVREQNAGVGNRRWHASLSQSRVVVVGAGAIGSAIAKRLRAFDAEVLPVARMRRAGVAGVDELPALLPGADVVILALPLTGASRGLFDEQLIARMKPGALLVNVARGEIVDTEALTRACLDGHISAALDVTAPEPLPLGHPLLTAPGVLITPHIGGTASSFEPRAKALIAAQIARYVRGEPLANVVTGDY